jgi:hypothetical protein
MVSAGDRLRLRRTLDSVPFSPRVEFLLAPVLAILVVALLALVLRWAFGNSGGWRAEPRPGAPGDQGLLMPLLTVRDPRRAAELVAMLKSKGVRASLSGPPGRQLLLVWPTEVARAAELLRTLPSGDR